MLEKLLDISRRTGDRLVVVEGDSAVVLLPLERYEEMLAGVKTVIRTAKPASAAAPEADPIASAGDELTGFQDQAAKPDDFRTVFDKIQGDGDITEEQFYLEPVD
jgi:hypothetical protein